MKSPAMLAVTLIALGGCAAKAVPSPAPPTGASSSAAGALGSASSSQTAAGSGPAPSSQRAGRAVRFTYVSDEGWHYSGTLNVPAVTVQFTKDISSAPPGRAAISETMTPASEADTSPQTFPDTDPGRPNGPVLTFTPGAFGYHLEKKITTQLDGGVTPNCMTQSPSFPDDTVPSDADLLCQLVVGVAFQATGPPYVIGGPDLPEKTADELIANLGSPYVWVTYLRDSHCSVWIYSDGRLRTSPSWQKYSCGTIAAA